MLLDWLFPKTCVGCGRLGTYFCPSCLMRFPLAAQICPMCGRGSIGGLTHARCRRPLGIDGLVSLFSYRSGIKVAVKRLKYRFVREMGKHFVDVAIEGLDPSVLSFFRDQAFCVVAVPLHRSRERWRGFNQADLLGELFAQRLDLQFSPALVRTKNTRALAELPVRLSAPERKSLDLRYPSITQRRMAERKFLSEKKSFLRSLEMKGAFKVSEKFKMPFDNAPSSSAGRQGKQISKFLLVDDVWTSGATMLACGKVLKRAGASAVWGFTFARGWR